MFYLSNFHRVAVASAFAVAGAMSASAEEARYQAVWHSGQKSSLTTAPMSLQAFLSAGEDLAASGLRLLDVETEMLNGRRVYAGLWRQGTGTNIMVGPMRRVAFRNEMRERREAGLRLKDFELFRRNGSLRYVGVWVPGSGREVLTRPLDADAFLARGAELTSEGLRLKDVEIERINGRILYSGLFQPGTGSNLISTAQRPAAFRNRRDEMVANGLELVDVERLGVGPRTRFVGVWSSGGGESRLSIPRDFPDFFVFSQDQFNDDKHAADFELFTVAVPDQDDDGGNGGGSSPVPGDASTADLPDPPAWVEFSGSTRLIVDFGQFVDGHPMITLPVGFLPDWLPRNADGEIVVPDNLCGFNVHRAGSFNWQTKGGVVVTDFPYNAVSNVADLGSNDFLGGIDFTGPIGGCAEDNEPWQFFQPLTQHGGDSPVPNLRLVIEMRSGSEIEFRNSNFHPEGLDADELFSDDVFETLKEIAEVFFELEEDNGYCEGVSTYMAELCDENPGICPVPADPQSGC